MTDVLRILGCVLLGVLLRLCTDVAMTAHKTKCGTQTGSRPTDRAALAAWNTRQGPPIGHCGDCAYSQNAKPNRKGFNICPASGMEITNADFCSYFEPKVHKKETDHESN